MFRCSAVYQTGTYGAMGGARVNALPLPYGLPLPGNHIVAGGGGFAHLVHTLFHRHVYRMRLVGVKSLPGFELGDQGQVVAALAVQETGSSAATGLYIY